MGRLRSGLALFVVAVVTAGTSDIPVAEEAAETLIAVGLRPTRLYDVAPGQVERGLAGALVVLQRAGQVTLEEPQGSHRALAPERGVRAVREGQPRAQLVVTHVAAAQERPQRHELVPSLRQRVVRRPRRPAPPGRGRALHHGQGRLPLGGGRIPGQGGRRPRMRGWTPLST